MGFRKKFNITRTTTVGHLDDVGNYVESTDKTTISIKASVQPLNNEETQALADGGRTARTVKLYTSTKLLPERQAYTDADGNNVQTQTADVLTYDGETWKIIMCNAYQSGVISHYKAYAQEVTGGN
ncbi:hypothetical protein [Pectinatus frisingensis]|uniref:hypothetical protein n=1 Tax=Pectinatus frisingensis TaxID=865 RepID=UPI0018C63B4F|nr:hypothetical protein [Pectinatus frisingensis]